MEMQMKIDFLKSKSLHIKVPKHQSIISGLLLLSFAVPAAVLSISLNAQEVSYVEEVVVTGVRGKPRTSKDSPVPVDVFSSDVLESVEFTDMNDIVRTLVPTYNLSRQPISDGATFIRPATLRGLPTDKTLVLVNGKRRHRAALVLIGGSGAQGPDLATIPAAAISGLEILRDGAAALYGSDAIAGVMNFKLKNNDSGGSLFVTPGEYYEGDGFNTTIGGNVGFSLGDGGFLSISGEHYIADATYRGNQYCAPWFCLDPNGTSYNDFITNGRQDRIDYATDPAFMEAAARASLEGDVVQPWGNPNAERTSIFFNAGMPVSEIVDFYAFGNFTESESDGSFFYRYPFNGTIEELREPDGSIYFPLEKYPGGFTPRFYGDVEDISLVTGFKSTQEIAFGWDVSLRMGESFIDYTLANTINPSMGPDSPKSFKPGTLTNSEFQFQVDLSYELSDTMTILGGISYLDEEYDIGEGEPDSYRIGPYAVADPWGFCDGELPTIAGQAVIDAGSTLNCANPDDPVYRAVGVGSNGFPGYSPAFSDVYIRDSFAAYVEVNADIGDSLFVQGAVRYEDYSDFGSETIYKIAGNYSLSDSIRLRASFNTGFRAPTPGQQGTTNVSTRLPNGFPVAVGLFPASGIVAQTLGATDLKPEKSNGFSVGITGNIGSADFTLDYYTIDVDDYFNAVSTRDVSNDPNAGDAYTNFLALNAAGVAGADNIGGVNWFTNAYDVGISGVDAVITLPIDSNLGTTDVTLTYGYNKFKFNSSPDGFLNAEAQHDIVNFDPNTRLIIQANHRIDNIGLNLRGSYWGEGSNRRSSDDDSAIQTFGKVFMTDLSFSYYGDSYTITAGGMNIFDKYPDKDSINDYCCGRVYPSTSGISWQGGRLYVKAEYMF